MGWFDDFKELIMGSKSKLKKKNRMDPFQQQGWEKFWNQGIEQSPLYGAGSDFLQNLLGGGPNAFSQFEAPYMQQFNQQIAPGIAERFAGMGAGSSSGLNQALSTAASGLQNQLAGLHGQLQMQALPQALQYAQQPYSNMLQGFGIDPYVFANMQGGPGLLHHFAQGAGQAIGKGGTIG